MTGERASLVVIEDFLAQERIATAGISRAPANFSVKLFEELCRRGHDVVPVNPNTDLGNGGIGNACASRASLDPPLRALTGVVKDGK